MFYGQINKKPPNGAKINKTPAQPGINHAELFNPGNGSLSVGFPWVFSPFWKEKRCELEVRACLLGLSNIWNGFLGFQEATAGQTCLFREVNPRPGRASELAGPGPLSCLRRAGAPPPHAGLSLKDVCVSVKTPASLWGPG